MTGVAASFRRDWERLWNVAEQLAATTGGKPETTFEHIGLLLERPDAPDQYGGYIASPLNTATFARTGGDGTHFGVVYTDDDAIVTPVVMTVPLQDDDPNHILGSSLPEFLALGHLTGFTDLESLAYGHSPEDLHRPSDDPTRRPLLQTLTTEFTLTPWPDIPARLEALANKHTKSLALDYAETENLTESDRAHEVLLARQATYNANLQPK